MGIKHQEHRGHNVAQRGMGPEKPLASCMERFLYLGGDFQHEEHREHVDAQRGFLGQRVMASGVEVKVVDSHNSSCAFVLSVLFVLKCAS